MTCSIGQIIFVSSAVKWKATYGHYGIGLFSIKVESGTMDWERIAAEAARTIPGRENGGNCDIKNLSHGCKVYFPVFVEGANLSMGDMHFSQGDGEVSFCGAIEMSGFLELR
jgi:formamidase